MAGGFAGTGSPGLALSNPGSLTLTDTGNTARTWNAGVFSINAVALTNISTLTVNGGGGSDTFNITPSPAFSTTVNGNSPTLGGAFPGDALNVNLSGLTTPTLSVTSNGTGLSGAYTLGGGRQPVSFTGIESGVLLPPTVAKAFGTNPVALNGTTNLTFTVSHSNLQPIGGGNSLTVSGLANLTGVSFSDALPAGLAVASPLSVTGACSGSVTNGANALAPGNTNIVLTGGVVPLNGTCAITVAVTPTTAGAKTNITSVITALESGPGVTTGTATLTVLPSVTINAPAITYGANGVVTVTVSANTAPTPTGNVTLTVDGGAGVVHALAGGVATFTVTAPAVGGHPLTVIYAGDGNYGAVPQSGTLSGTLTVNKAPLTVTADNKTITYGTSPAFTATISGFVNGDTAAVVSGAASFSTNATLTNGNPNAGSWTITPAAGTLAATNYTFTTFANGALTVNKANLSVTANNPTITYGAALPASSVTFGGFVNGDTAAVVSGTAAFSTNATLTNGNPNAGSWTITPAAGTLTAANYTFTPFVGGALTVNKANLSVTSSNATITYGAALPASSVTFSGFVNGDTAAVVSGAASFSTNATLTNGNPNAGSWTITPAAGTLAAANYTFTPFNNGALTVNKVNLSVTANNASKSFGATLPAFSAAITGFVNGDTLSVVSGSPSFSTTATVASPPGNYPITPAVGTLSAANYTFTTFVAGSLTVGKGNTTTVLTNSGSSLIATIVPGASGLPSPTGTVQFLNGGSVVGSVTVAGGTATFSQTSGTITAVYSGDNNYVASTSNPVTLGTPTPPATSSLSLSSSLNPSSSGQAVTFVANLSTGGPSAVPTGTVVFLDGTTSLGTRPISSSQASFTSSSLSSGTHTITAQYSGDNTFPAAQASLVQTVNGTVTMTVSASPSTAVFGQAVTLTANVSAGSGSAGLAAPTGQVTFTIPGSTFFGSSITLGTATLSSGAATINTTTLPLGTTIITAQYSGDSSWSAASRTVTVAVTQASTTTAISLTMSSGQLALTAVVGAVAPGGGTPTGSVQFTDTADNSVIATANLTAGRASAPLAASAASSVIGHSIVAVYSGDANFKTSTSPALPTIVSAAANLSANVAGDEIVSIFGLTGLNGDTAATLPLTTSLGGVTVNVTDSAGTSQLALLYGVFASAGQINFLIPGGLASGLATVVITLPGGGTVTLVTNIAGAAPGIFTASMTGQGVYAGQVIFAHSDGSQTVGNPAVMNPGSTTFTPGPINLGTPGDQVYLVLYGTGIRHAGSVTAAINGVNVPVTYFGAQGAYAGLDQMNLGPVPKSLIGAGQVNLVITADSHAANTVTLAFQ
jgi:hypothetical protein